ncbi:helix-turn-helix domain-containing protein [Paraburkholderia sp. CNPSo 3157]|uniref:Helix-turn-helix domain-containing protein n=1 Tax=Paraburkholderia franconis TaxID=2654983 RepID=A0A7X1NBE7_9BURK|nr:XRE family transcriptional regulator [Paraburkholderia franconis]MPW18879.1 helix-turn-helix domain-containing protein [Paraburkholderia franconis]
MARKFEELRASMSPESRARAKALANKLRAEMPLHELRHARGLSQDALAKRLNIKQPSIAKLEQRTDMYISTLRDHIRALGGELEIIARFPEGEVQITNFAQLDQPVREPAQDN